MCMKRKFSLQTEHKRSFCMILIDCIVLRSIQHPTSNNFTRLPELRYLLEKLKKTFYTFIVGKNRAPSPADSRPNTLAAGGSSDESRSKPRSRSLIRRSSRKAKQQIRDAQSNGDDCIVQ